MRSWSQISVIVHALIQWRSSSDFLRRWSIKNANEIFFSYRWFRHKHRWVVQTMFHQNLLVWMLLLLLPFCPNDMASARIAWWNRLTVSLSHILCITSVSMIKGLVAHIDKTPNARGMMKVAWLRFAEDIFDALTAKLAQLEGHLLLWMAALKLLHNMRPF